jgi:hypothetical protein
VLLRLSELNEDGGGVVGPQNVMHTLAHSPTKREWLAKLKRDHNCLRASQPHLNPQSSIPTIDLASPHFDLQRLITMSLPPSAMFPNTHQELSLFAYIADARKPQLLKILSGITGMAPEVFFNHHLVFKPKPKPSKPVPTSVDLYYIQLVSRVLDTQEGNYKPREQRWSMRLDDFPEVTRKPVVSRAVYSANSGMGDVIGFMEEIGYTYVLSLFLALSSRLGCDRVLMRDVDTQTTNTIFHR